MTVNKRKKVGKYRGGSTHGYGYRKKHRGAGNRGGRGRAGRGKRSKARKQIFPKLGRHGFTSIRSKKTEAINIAGLNELIKRNKIEKKEDIYLIDLSLLGYQKLLGSGETERKLQIKVEQYSKQAEEKIKKAGGLIISPQKDRADRAKKDEAGVRKEKAKVMKEKGREKVVEEAEER